MAPRGRHRRVGLRRIDAAVDAMEPLGFSKELVRKTIKNLLNVYDGDAGWVFIEEASYKLLIDTILEEQEKGSLKDDSSHEEARGGDDAQSSTAGPSYEVPDDAEPSATGLLSGITDDAEPSAAGPSGGVVDDAEPSAAGPASELLELTCSSLEVVDTALQLNQTEGKDCLPPAEGKGRGWRDIVLHKNSSPKQMDNGIGNNDGNSGAAIYLGNSLFHSPLHAIHSTEPVTNLPKKRRKRCHGWISNDDEDDFMFLTPSILPRQVENMIGGIERRRNRKTRWDVKPEDM